MSKSKSVFILSLMASVLALSGIVRTHAEAPKAEPAKMDHAAMASDVKEFTEVAVEYQGTKVWIPGTIIVNKGQKVRIKLINNIPNDPNTHGFAIDEYGIKAVVARGTPQTVEFTADKAGVFSIYCQLHPAHVGGQLLVLQ